MTTLEIFLAKKVYVHGRFRRNALRQTPMFALELWNMFHRTFQDLPRTNNSLEGWHRSFQASASACHPVFWKFLEILKRIFEQIGIHLLQLEDNLLTAT